MPFHKYPDIENTYRKKHLDKFLRWNPNVTKATFYYQVKLDGSNFQLIFDPDEEVKVGKRSGIVGEGTDHMGVKEKLPEYSDVVDCIKEYVNETGDSVNLYGEVFGKGIQNRIYYGDDIYLRFFDIGLNGVILSYFESLAVFPYVVSNYYVNTYGLKKDDFNFYIGGYYTFQDIRNADETVKIPEGHEGVVIKQFSRIEPEDNLLMLKKKDERFQEKGNKNKSKKKEETDPEVERLKQEFESYINENRVKSVFSKEGEIEEPQQIGEYIKLVMQDAIEDFQKDVDVSDIDKNKMRKVYKKANGKVADILKQYL